MDKEQIEEIVKRTCNREGVAKRCPERITEVLINAGYGNVEQAIEGFAKLIKAQMSEQAYGIDLKGAIFYEKDIDNLAKIFLGKAEKSCATCKWHTYDGLREHHVCCNEHSAKFVYWTKDDDCCEQWESK